jgi:cytidyltransferase-like protein
MKNVIVSGGFDDLRSPQVRFLHEASRLGPLHAYLWSDQLFKAIKGKDPKFPFEERQYFLQGIRYVNSLSKIDQLAVNTIPVDPSLSNLVWAIPEQEAHSDQQLFAQTNVIDYQVISARQMAGFPIELAPGTGQSGKKKVIVTGCYDWLHSGHVRFFEEVSELGDLYVAIGNDENVRFLKGPGHPLFKEPERLYMVQAIRFVTQALVSTGNGWLDAEPEIHKLKPDMYAVNHDGDKPEKSAFCAEHGIQYVVLKRTPKEGLPRRESTKLRGF